MARLWKARRSTSFLAALAERSEPNARMKGSP
jgi:hypothetical protein